VVKLFDLLLISNGSGDTDVAEMAQTKMTVSDAVTIGNRIYAGQDLTGITAVVASSGRRASRVYLRQKFARKDRSRKAPGRK
jgi:hypothetical protein